MYQNHHQQVTPQFNSSTVVLAEKIQEERLARKNYSALLKTNAPRNKISQALQEWKKLEGELDSLLYSVIAKPRMQNARERIGGGVLMH